MTERAHKFDRDGYVVVPNLISHDDVDDARRAAAAIIESFEPADHPTVFCTGDHDAGRDQYFMDSAEAIHCFVEADAVDDAGRLTCDKQSAINKIGHALHDLDPTFKRLCRLPQIASLLRELGYRKPNVWQTMYLCKPPRIGGEVRWHQDASYLATRPATVTGIWIALQDANRDNGCLWVQPGGHSSPLREIYEVTDRAKPGVLRTLDDTPWPASTDGIPVEVSAGDAVIFSDHMPHYSSHNHSDRSRHAFALHVAENNAMWSTRNWLQRNTLGRFPV
jgi:phytanoyl-CoA hydroxylase